MLRQRRTADLGKWILRLAAAVLGTVLALAVFVNFEIFEVRTTAMLPVLEPGMRVLVQSCDADDVELGDIVLFEAEFYDFDTQDGLRSVRMVSGMNGDKVRLSCSPEAVYGDELTIEADKILGKVILWERKNAN